MTPISPQLSIALAATAFAASALSIPLFKRLAGRFGWVDAAGGDPLKIHAAPVPFVGGLGIGLGCLLALAVALASMPFHAPAVALVLAVGLGVAALGFTDDVASIRPAARLGVELLAGLALAGGGLSLGLFGSEQLPRVGALGAALFVVYALFYVVGAINAVNMQDGLDGLAGGVVLVSCVGFALVAAARGDAFVLALALGLGGALAAFLVYNFHPASVFMGDNGSYLLGFLVATMALATTAGRWDAAGVAGGVLMVGAPVFDAAFAIARRLGRGASPFAGDRSHFYDLLSQKGLSTRAVALASYAVQAALVAAGAALLLGG